MNVFIILKNINDDCVSAFEKGGDEEDVVYITKTILSIAYNTVFDKLSESNVLENIDQISDSITIIPDSDILEVIIINDDFTSNQCDVSDNDSDIASLDEYSKQCVITNGLCNVKLKTSKI